VQLLLELEQRAASSFSRRCSGTPVIFETTSAMTSSSTDAVDLLRLLAPLLLDLILLLAAAARPGRAAPRPLVVRGLDRLVLLDRQPLDVRLELARSAAWSST
jgi:hypothetical protein